MDQEVKILNLKDLVLWTENPRDPIDVRSEDQDIVNRAFLDANNKWSLEKLAKEMGDYYDFSELPTIVYINSRPVVYDGNRRIILGKIQHRYVSIPDNSFIDTLPSIPQEIPCNVCTEEIALNNVYRKHADSGSWSTLERDMFVDRFMKKGKSIFLQFEECTGMISSHPSLNQRFVKEEILTEHILNDLGFEFRNNQLYSRYESPAEALEILNDLEYKIRTKEISTRKNRGAVKKALNPSTISLINNNAQNDYTSIELITAREKEDPTPPESQKRKTKRVKVEKLPIFGGSLYLRPGETSNLYRDILDLYEYYESHKMSLSDSFPSLIRMAMRLLCETAVQEDGCDETMHAYLKKHFQKAKSCLSSDAKTFLSSNNVTETTILQLLHLGAHNYTASKNISQTLAISLILGAMLSLTHGK